jgi:hypothetical protein
MFKRYIERLIAFHLYPVKRKIERLEILERAARERMDREERHFRELLELLGLRFELHRCPPQPRQIVKVKK